jgi:dienelactone hydrolase
VLRRPAGSRRRRRTGAGATLLPALAALAIALLLVLVPGLSLRQGAQAAAGPGRNGGTGAPGPPKPMAEAPAFAVGVRRVMLLDRSRTIKLKRGLRGPRPLLTYIRYPAVGSPGGAEEPDAAPDPSTGPYPMVVFGHGFGVTPAIYSRLLDAWASAGFVVAAPLFPLANGDTPGGPEESDVVNQPRDMSFVISSMLSMNAPGAGPLAGLINPSEIAVAGHSDGAETALAVAFSRRMRDPRVRAALVFSGAKMSGVGGYSFTPALPLLAVQGTADIDNEPRYTDEYFAQAGRPKFLLRLLGAAHLPPYTDEEPQLGIVERTSLAFLERYLEGQAGALARLLSSGSVPGRSALASDP